MQAPNHPPDSDLLAEVLAYCEARNVPQTRFGREAAGDGSLVSDLMAGRELRRPTRDAVRRYMLTGEPRKRTPRT